ncbi:MAG TPA: zf-HC2 domain-containing protein [Anaerolineae bacterium]|nr:zf-HC2 domain-containing protein [Anaerolineae bacterium]
MDCKDFVDQLSAYIDSELTADERRHVASHLDDCPSCRAQLAALKDTVSMVHGLGELDVPTDVSHALRQIAEDGSSDPAPARRWLAMPRLRYLVATGAVAAIALVSVLALIDMGGMNNQTSVEQASDKAEGKSKYDTFSERSLAPEERGKSPGGVEQHYQDATAKDLTNGTAKRHAITPYASSEASSAMQKSDELLSRGLPDSTNQSWPMVLTSKKDYDPTSAEALLDDIHKKTDGIYSVKDASDKRAQILDALIKKVTAQGGDGELLRSPINALLDRTKRAALPVYLEKATFKKQDCLLIIIKWGFGSEASDLYKTSLYVTDLSGWNIIHYASR